MSYLNLEVQNNIPILTLDPLIQYYPDSSAIKKHLSDDSITFSNEIIIDLSNYLRVNADLINHLIKLSKEIDISIKKIGLIIPGNVFLDGLKVKLIDDFIEIYGSKYDAIYNLIN